MLTIAECRAYLEDQTSSDDEILAIRNALYDSSQLAFEIYWSDLNSGSKNLLGLLKVIDADTSI